MLEQGQIQEPAAAVGGAVGDVASSDVGRILTCLNSGVTSEEDQCVEKYTRMVRM